MDREALYNKFVTYKWWSNIEKRQIESWMNNFVGYDKTIGKLILDNIIFYSGEQLDSYTRYIVNQIQSEIYQKIQQDENMQYRDDKYYFDCWGNYIKSIKVIPAAIPGKVVGSPYRVIDRYRKYLGEDAIASVDSIEEAIRDEITEFIFVDDFSGSGNQIRKFLQTNITIMGEKIRICDLHKKYSNITITVIVYVIHNQAIELIKSEFPNIRIRYVDYIDENMNFLNKNSIMYGKLNDLERERIISYISQKKEDLIGSDPKYEKTEQYQLNIPIVFEHGCPNNALILLYALTDNWNQLFKLGDEQ